MKTQTLPAAAHSTPLRTWYFTYGSNHVDASGESLGSSFTPITVEGHDLRDDGGFNAAREKMAAARAERWSMQYEDEEKAGITKWGLAERSLESVALPNAPQRPKEYIGDSVYAAFDGIAIILTTENGVSVTNTIVLESEVFAALGSFVERIVPKAGNATAKMREIIAEKQREHDERLRCWQSCAHVIEKVPADLTRKCYVGNEKALDIDNLTRHEVVRVLAALQGGKWKKELNTGNESLIDYIAEIEGVRVRLWAAAPPETCRIIEVTEEIPAKKVTRKKLICAGDQEEAAPQITQEN